MKQHIKEQLEAKRAEVAESQQQQAAEARWDKLAVFRKAVNVNWHEVTVESGMEFLAELRKAAEEGGRIIAQRLGTNSAKTEVCHECRKEGLKKWSACKTLTNKAGIAYNIFFCSPPCYERYQTKTIGGVIR